MTSSALAAAAPPRRTTGRRPARQAVGSVDRCGHPSPAPGPVQAGVDLIVAAEPGTAATDFVAFFDRMLPVAVGVARRILGDQASAEDAASEALARAYLRWGSLRDMEYREAWVVRVATNEALGLMRKRSRRERILRRQPAPGHAAAADEGLRDSALADQVRALPRRQREVVALRYFAEMSTEEVAAALDISPGSVKTHLHRAVATLRTEGRAALGEALDV
jgi:RNA polymerase sigma-70 factor (ECF subfamily)